MAISSAIVLYVIMWAMTFLVALPIRVQTQGDLGELVPGTHAGAPVHHHLKKKAWITTAVAFVLWAIAVTVIVSGWIRVSDLDWFNLVSTPE